HALRVDGRRGVERPRRRRLPVDDDLLLRLVVDPAAADVERVLDVVEIEPAEAEASLGVLEGDETPRRPRVERRLRDLAVGVVARARDDVAHALQTRVGAVDVGLLGRELRMCHRSYYSSVAVKSILYDADGNEVADEARAVRGVTVEVDDDGNVVAEL